MNSFRKIVRGLRNSSQQFRVHFGLTSAQFFVLQQIHNQNGLSLNTLADLTFTHQSTVSEMVGRLVSLGLVSKAKAKSDSRSVALSLTTKGRRMLLSSPKTAQENLAEAILSLSEKKRIHFSKLLAELVTKAKFSNESSSLFFEASIEEGSPNEK